MKFVAIEINEFYFPNFFLDGMLKYEVGGFMLIVMN